MMSFIKFCDHEPQLIYSTKNANYYASDADNVQLFEGKLIVNVSAKPGIRSGSNIYKVPTLAKHMVDFPEELTIYWRDFADPPVKSSFWAALDDYAKTKKYKDILFHCEHGHGRTGTGLCSVMIAKGGLSAAEAINRIRDEYCRQCVESPRQVYYLLCLDEELNGRTVPTDDAELHDLVDSLTPPMVKHQLVKRYTEYEDTPEDGSGKMD